MSFLPEIGGVRQFVVVMLVGVAIALPGWSILRRRHLRATGEKVHAGREFLLALFVVYAVMVVVSTTVPLVATSGAAIVNIVPFRTISTCVAETLQNPADLITRCIANLLGNFALLFPFGLLAPMIFPRMSSLRGLLSAALWISLGIETLQLVSNAFGARRTADIDDVILNVTGALVGFALVSLVRKKLPRIFPSPSPSPIQTGSQRS